MYASAMKFCGAMELCGIGYPAGQPVDHPWPDVLDQIKAQKAGLVVAITRGHKPEEADFCRDKGFAAVYQFKNPRTGTISTLWIKDFTEAGEWQTHIPESIPWTGGPPTTVQYPGRLSSIRTSNAPMQSAGLDEPRVFRYTGNVPAASSSVGGPIQVDYY